MPAVLDTHAAVWYLLDSEKLPKQIYTLIDAAATGGTPTYISAISLVEVAYLAERGRIAAGAFDRFFAALEGPNPAFRIVPLDSAVAAEVRRVPRNLVPEMPDRIIAATALHLAMPLVTRDRRLQSSGFGQFGLRTIW